MKHVMLYRLITFFLGWFPFSFIHAQQAPAPVSTYALVVGISKYGNENMPQLNYAHRDAELFAEYLKASKVPEENISLLLNEEATSAAILTKLKWLLQSAGKNDIVYFYFSGHGDTENETVYKDGFLLSYNTPRNNYTGNAISIDYLNKVTNTLTSENGAKVILITDACHSGKLAGAKFQGTIFTAEQLRKVRGNEVRLTSCKPDQLSQEDEAWGQGRGVFSFYLLNGLMGGADAKNKGFVSLGDIARFLDSSISKDPVLKKSGKKQNPVLEGNNAFVLAKVDASSRRNVQAGPVVTASVVGKPLPSYFFDIFSKQPLEHLLDFRKLDQLPVEQVPVHCVDMLYESVRSVLANSGSIRSWIGEQKAVRLWNSSIGDFTKMANLTRLSETDSLAFAAFTQQKAEALKQKLAQDPNAAKSFMEKLLVRIGDYGQTAINQYLEGSAEELEKRAYYQASREYYELFPYMFSLASKLAEKTGNDFYKKQLDIKYQYFSGVVKRLKLPASDNPGKLLDSALQFQLKAMELEPDAAYIQNELGVIYALKNKNPEALLHFRKATELAPEWAIARSQLAYFYGVLNKMDSAMLAYKTARVLQPDYPGVYTSAGYLYLQQKNYLLAEEMFRRSIQLNSRYYQPFEKLGDVYTQTTDYYNADSMYWEAEKRKKGIKNAIPLNWLNPVDYHVASNEYVPCGLDYTRLDTTDMPGRLLMGLKHLEAGNTSAAEAAFNKVINLDTKNPLAYHLLGKIFYMDRRRQEAEAMFQQAELNYLDTFHLGFYFDSALKKSINGKVPCALENILQEAYDIREDYFYAGHVYELWNHFEDAAAEYNKLIRVAPCYIGGYYKLWRLREQQGRYMDALRTIESYGACNKPISDSYLNSFYQRMMKRLPEHGYWNYLTGQFYYGRILQGSVTDRYQPDTEIDEFNRLEAREDKNDDDNAALQEEEQFPMFVNKVRDHETYSMKTVDKMPETLPGTGEVIFEAKAPFKPFTWSKRYYKKALQLLQDDEELVAEVNFKLGEIYTRDRMPDSSLAFYNRALFFKPGNANIRMRLVDNTDKLYYFEEGLTQLDSLFSRHEITRPHQELYTRYLIHAGRFADAKTTLRELLYKYSDTLPLPQELRAKLFYMSGDYKNAITSYQQLNSRFPNMQHDYTLARLYALQNDPAQSWVWLRKAVAGGFNFKYVLQFDPAMELLRKSGEWSGFIEGVKGRFEL